MRDPGLSEAIQAAGGVSELARRVGVSQPSVSNWDKIPAERVLVVEAATGVDRKVLRPDLYQERDNAAPAVDEIDIARAQEYALLSTLLVRAPECRAAEEALRRCAAMRRRSASRMSSWLKPRRRPRCSGSSANTSICSSGSGAANCCPTGRSTLPASCTSVRSRACASDLAALRDRAGRRQLRARGSRRDAVRDHGRHRERQSARRRKAPSSASSRNIFCPGSAASSPIWSVRTRPASTAASERSAACSWTSRRKRSRCRRETAAAKTTNLEGMR